MTVVGTQWGDEGKGKIVDWLASGVAGARYGAVVRFNGGANAGHTLWVEGQQYKLTLVPSGVLTGALGVIGPGVMVDPFALVEEIDRLRADGVRVGPETLRVAETVTLVLPVHQHIDAMRDTRPGAIGTTGRGIGPAYEDKVARRAVRLCDVFDAGVGRERFRRLLAHHESTHTAATSPALSFETAWDRLCAAANRLAPYAERTPERLWQLGRDGRAVLFEGAQSVMLDVEHGTYPYVTSSSCVPAGAAAGAGVGPDRVGQVLGVAKAYLTRVGAGPFPTEDSGAAGRHLASRGREVGTNTGRARRCGWLDAVMLRYACRVAGIQRLALTKLDVLDGLPRVRVATAYEVREAQVTAFPVRLSEQFGARPVYEEMDGWHDGGVTGVRSGAALPSAALRFIRRVEELVEVPIAVLSTGPDRTDTFCLDRS